MLCLCFLFLNGKETEAAEKTGTVVISVEKFTLGQGYLIEPTVVPIYEGDNCAMLLDRVLNANGYTFEYNGTLNSGFYMKGINNADNGKTKIPDVIKNMDRFFSGGELYKPPGDDTINENAPDLFEFSYGKMSGWMYTLNGIFDNGMSIVFPKDGDVMRVQYSVYGYGADLGSEYEGSSVTPLDIADKNELTKRVAEINNEKEKYFDIPGFDEKYNNAMAILEQLDVQAWKVAGALEELKGTEVIYPTSILMEKTINVEMEETFKCNPVLQPENVTATKLVFSSSDKCIAEVDENGVVTPKGVGEADITATTSNGLSSICHVTVYKSEKTLAGIRVEDICVNVGAETKVNVISIPEDSDTAYNLIFKSDNEEILTVDKEGNVKGKQAGTANVVVTAALENNPDIKFSVNCTVTVVEGADDIIVPLDEVLDDTAKYILSVDTNPGLQSQWNVIGLMRNNWNVPQSYIDTFYNNVVTELEEKQGVLSKTKYSDYSKLILSLTSIGIDAQNVAGYNLLSNLADFDNVIYQGFNGPVWALIALNSHPSYKIPEIEGLENQTTENILIQYLLSHELESGGWSLIGTQADVDITAMTIQALAPYYQKKGYEDVTNAIERALTWLSIVQRSDGGYYTLSENGQIDNSESTSQVLTAISMLGIDCRTDSRFIKGGKWIVNALLSYRKDGGFMHIKEGGTSNGGAQSGTVDGMATEQAYYALTAYKRMLSGKTALYDMSDVNIEKGESNTTGSQSSQTNNTEQTIKKNEIQTQQKTNTTNKAVKKPTRVVIKCLKRLSSSKVKITWKKIKNVDGYQIYCSSKKNSGYKKIKTLSGTKTSLIIKKTGKKKWFFKIRAYKKNGSKKVYGRFSKVKSIKKKQ